MSHSPPDDEELRSAIRYPEEPWEIEVYWEQLRPDIVGAGALPRQDNRVSVPEWKGELGFSPNEVLYWGYSDAVDLVIVGDSEGYLHDHDDKRLIAANRCKSHDLIRVPSEFIGESENPEIPTMFEPGMVLIYLSPCLSEDQWFAPRSMTFVITPEQAIDLGWNNQFVAEIVQKARIGKQHWHD